MARGDRHRTGAAVDPNCTEQDDAAATTFSPAVDYGRVVSVPATFDTSMSDGTTGVSDEGVPRTPDARSRLFHVFEDRVVRAAVNHEAASSASAPPTGAGQESEYGGHYHGPRHER